MSHVTIILEDKAKSAPTKGVKPEPVTPLNLAKDEVKKSPATPAKRADKKIKPDDPEAKAKSRAAASAEIIRKGES